MHLRPQHRVGLVAAAAVASLAMVGCGGATTATAPEAAGGGADGTGIHVTGAWEVTVSDPDGTVASQVAFHNDLVADGAEMLAWILGVPGTSMDDLDVIPSGSELCDAPNAINCALPQTREVDTSNNAAIHTMSVEAPSDGTVDRVLTRTSYEVDGQFRNTTFTDRVLDSPVSFVEGQTVDISVTLTFS